MTDRELLEEILNRVVKTEEAVHKTNLIIENQINPAIDALAEGQDLTHQMMKDLATKDEVEDLKQEMRLIKTVVAAHSREIEALKKAQ